MKHSQPNKLCEKGYARRRTKTALNLKVIRYKCTDRAMRADAYAVRQLHDKAHKRPSRTIDIGQEHIMGHKELCG